MTARSLLALDQVIARFARLAERYCDIERLSRLRAIKLKRLLDPSVIALHPVRHPAAPLLVVVVVVVAIFSTAGFSAQRIRAPP